MAFPLSNSEWEAPVCPPSSGSAGYAFDNDDVYSVGVGNFGLYTFAALSTPANARTLPTYHITSSTNAPYCISSDTAASNEFPLFGKQHLRLTDAESGDHINYPSSLVIPSGSDWTWSAWVRYQTTDSVGLTADKIFISQGSVSVYIESLAVWDFIAVALPRNAWNFIRVVRVGAVVTLYLNGVLIGNITTRYNTTRFILPSARSTSNQTLYIRDLVISKVARNGLFLPTGIIGY